MKVLQINSVYEYGSTGRIVAQLKTLIEKQGDECLVAYGRGNSDKEGTYKIGSLIDLCIHGALSRITDKAGFYSTRKTKKLIKTIKMFEPDIIHLHNIHGYYLNVEMLFEFLKIYKKPIIWTFHDCWPYTGHCAFYMMEQCEKWKVHCNKCPKKHDYPASILADNSWENFERKKNAFLGVEDLTIITPSEWLASEVKKSFLSDYKIEVIPNGVDVGTFRRTQGKLRQELGLEGKKIVLGVASVWAERKGLTDFLKLAERLDDEYVVVLVGLKDKQIEDLPNNVVGIKRTNNVEELAELYSEASVLFNPTYEDNFPMVNLEALACGTPVITYKTGGSPEAIDEKTGICIEQGDITSAIEILEKIEMIHREDCVDKGKKFDIKCRMRDYLELYYTTIKGM